ncbi:hypothetical protein ES703_11889 [subsurface metagenome]
MSNSFNISVKPEIAAVSAAIAANLVHILSNASALATIQTTDLPGIATQNTNIKSVVDAIADPQLPDIITAIGANETKIDSNKTVLDLIQAKTDLLPLAIRGKFYQTGLSMASSDNALVTDISGHGKVYMLCLQILDSGDEISLTLNIDGDGWVPLTHTGDTDNHPLVFFTSSGASGIRTLRLLAETDVRNKMFNLEFESSLKLYIRRSSGTAANVKASIYYFLDT